MMEDRKRERERVCVYVCASMCVRVLGKFRFLDNESFLIKPYQTERSAVIKSFHNSRWQNRLESADNVVQ